jgi:hypothetical protein
MHKGAKFITILHDGHKLYLDYHLNSKHEKETLQTIYTNKTCAKEQAYPRKMNCDHKFCHTPAAEFTSRT